MDAAPAPRRFHRTGPPPPASPEALAALEARLTGGRSSPAAEGASRADWAGYYRSLRMALCALPPGSKGPNYEDWPNRALDPGHWRAHPEDGIGAVLGPSRLVSLDLDAPPEAREVLTSLGLDLDALTAEACLIQGNPARLRALYRAPAGVALSRRVLTWPPREPGGKPLTLFELRAGPVQDVLPPTVHPETGRPYTWLRPPWELERLGEPPAELLELWTNWDAWRPALEALCPWVRGEEPRPRSRGPEDGLSVISQWNQAHDVGEILSAHGYRPKGARRWVAPSSTSGLPGVVLLPDSGRVYSHHASDPLATGHALDPFDLFAILDHGGDYRGAVRAAAELLGLKTHALATDKTAKTSLSSVLSVPPGAHSAFEVPHEWPDPEPLPGLPEVPAFEPGLLPEAIRAWVFDTSERIQAPADFSAAAAMVALAAVVGRRVGMRPKRRDDWTVIPNLWGAVVGRPGVMKSPALTEPLRPLTRLEAVARDVHELELMHHEAARLVAEQRKAVGKEEVRKALKAGRDPEHLAREAVGEAQEPPRRRRYLTNDTTVEKLGELLRDNPRGILVFRDELTGLLRALDKEGQEGARAFYLEAWNGSGRFTYDRIGRGTLDIEAACVSVLGGIQPGPLGVYLRGALAGGAGDDGLLQRFQIVVWPDTAAEWRDIDRWPDSAARARAWAVFERLDDLNPDALGAEREGDGPPFLRFGADAQELFSEWRAALEHRLRAGEEHPAFEAHLSKYRSLIPSLALILHLADHPEGGPVGEGALLAACAWGEYLEGHARRLYAPAVAGEVPAARELLRHLQRGDLGERFTLREVLRKGWRGLDRESTSSAADLLAELGYLRAQPVETGGRPRLLYVLNPRAAQ